MFVCYWQEIAWWHSNSDHYIIIRDPVQTAFSAVNTVRVKRIRPDRWQYRRGERLLQALRAI